MSIVNMSIVKQAAKYFKSGEYQLAKVCYQQAAEEYGYHLFAGNIRLCDFRLSTLTEAVSFQQTDYPERISLDYKNTNGYKAIDANLVEKIKFKSDSDEKDYVLAKNNEIKIILKSWISDAEDIKISIFCKQDDPNLVGKSIGIAKVKFFNNEKIELKNPGLTNLSWSDHLNCWYFYLQGLEAKKEELNVYEFIKPVDVAYIEITLDKWKCKDLFINNKVNVVRKPSILQILRQDFVSLLNELNNPVVKEILDTSKGRVCYVLNHSLPYQSEGYATRAHGIAQAIKAQGLDIVCLTRPGYPWSFLKEYKEKELPKVEEIDNVSYQRICEPKGWKGSHNYITKAADELERKFKELKPSCVMAASDFKNALPALLAARRLGIPFIYELRGFWEITQASKEPKVVQTSNYHLTQYLEAQVAVKSDHIFILTEAMRQELISKGIPAEKITVLPNSCDPDKFDPLKNPKDIILKTELNIPNGVPVIGYIGTFNSYEGLDDLIHACGGLFKAGVNFRVLLVGAEPSTTSDQGQNALHIQNLAKEYGFEDWLIMPGRISHDMVSKYYSLVDIAPFMRKPLPVTELVSPLKPLEAMAMGKSLVVSSVSALAEMINDGETGLIFQKGNVEDLANKLLIMLKDVQLRNRLGVEARKWVIKERTWEICAKKVKERIDFIEKNTPKTLVATKPKILPKLASEYKVAFIADEFSYNSFKDEFEAIIIEPDNWEKLFKEHKPDIFFCESAWSGVDSKRRPWQGKIYTSINWKRENRTILFNILNYCRKNGIPTVFWNKEDPTHFTDRVHDFIATAKEFDFVFTTAEECCDSYRSQYGVKNVYALPFATNPKLFNPNEQSKREDKVVFAGSWYENHKERSLVTEQILDALLSNDFDLEIYDRYYGTTDQLHQWPNKYKEFLKPGLPHDKMPEVYRSGTFGLNLNTVTESTTMFARRVFELMSSNTLVVSNYSKGVEKMFGDLVVFADKEPDRLKKLTSKEIDNIREQALDLVLSKHTYTNRWQEVLTKIGVPWIQEDENLTMVCKVKNEQEIDTAIDHFQNYYAQNPDNKLLLLIDENVSSLDVSLFYQNYNRVGISVTSMYHIQNYALADKYHPIETKFFVYSDIHHLPNDNWVQKAKLHLQYVEDVCITHQQGVAYQYLEHLGEACLLGYANMFTNVIEDISKKTIRAYSV